MSLEAAATMTITLVLSMLIFSTNVVESAHHGSAAAPAPAVDCSNVIISMVDCLSYVTAGSAVKTPEGQCCSVLKSVLKSNSECLCEAFKNSAQLGVSFNITKALSLPAACHLSAPSFSNCGLSLGGAPAPAISPSAMSPGSFVLTPSSTGLAPGPNQISGASMLVASSALTLIFGLLVIKSTSLL